MPDDKDRQPPPPPGSLSQLLSWLPTPLRAALAAEEERRRVQAGRLYEALPEGLKSFHAMLQEDFAPRDRRPQPSSAYPQLRAATTTERIADKVQDFYAAAAATPHGKMTDLFGLTDLAGMAHSFSERPEVLAAAPAPKPGKRAAEVVVPALVREIQALFPKLDSYGKPTGRLTAATMAKRIEKAGELLSPEAKAALTSAVEQVGDRRIAPQELHAIVQGQTYKPDRILRKVKAIKEGEKQIPGAPLGVSNARQERAIREQYMDAMQEGVVGREWYTEAGEDLLFHANDDPVRASLLTGDIAITSPQTAVSGNTGMGVKGYNQANAGVPVETGRFTTAMSKGIEAAHAEGSGATGLKRQPFQQNIAKAGGYLDEEAVLAAEMADLPLAEQAEAAIERAGRPTNDIWQGEAFKYVYPDGTPMRQGFSPAQHRWMDEQTKKILMEANRRGIGGFTNWDVRRAQAAAWVAAKVRAGEIAPADAAKHYGDYLRELYAQGERSVIPGRSTGHLPELHEPGNEPFQQMFHDLVTAEGGMYDVHGRDQITAGFGGLVGRSFDAPSLAGPTRQTLTLTGSLAPKGAPAGQRVLDEGSRRLMDAAEATHGLLSGSDTAGYSRLLPAGSRVARTGWDVTLPGGTLTREQVAAVATKFPNLPPRSLTGTPTGLRVTQVDEPTARAVAKLIGGTVADAGIPQGNRLPQNWQQAPAGQGFFEAVRRMGRGPERFDAFAPAMAATRRRLDAQFAKSTGGRFTLSPVMDEVQGAMANEGWAGLERLAKKFGIPAAALAMALSELQALAPRADTGSESTGPKTP